MQASENFVGRASSSTTPTDYQPLTNEWGKKWGKINGNAQFWAFLFCFVGKKTGAFHNAPAILINQMRKEPIQGYCWCFIFRISQTTAIDRMATSIPMAMPPTSCLSCSHFDKGFSTGIGICWIWSSTALNSSRCALKILSYFAFIWVMASSLE